MTDVHFTRFQVLTFDCYGTLIDWERGIVSALRPVLVAHGIDSLDDGALLETYARLEAARQRGPFRPYADVLDGVVADLGTELGFDPGAAELTCLADSIGSWPPFPDTVDALNALSRRYRLGIISNIDDRLFARTAERLLPVRFDYVVTAEQVGAYKPSLDNFQAAFDRIGLPKERILHVAQSLYHDIAPANHLGLATAWVDRRRGVEGGGATAPAEARPDLVVPDLRSLVERIEAEGA